MQSATSTLGTAPPRTPAWKRLGLKLKSAQDVPGVETRKEIEPSAKKRKVKSDGDSAHPSKKAKQGSESRAAALPVTPKLIRKKSVTFTPETKVEDGDSIKQLFNNWVTEQKAQDPTFGVKSTGKAFDTPAPPKVHEHFDTALDEKERRVKRVEKSQPAVENGGPRDKSKKKAKIQKVVKPTAPTTRPFLAYLRQYHEDRANWKFNKNHQNHILKNLFDINAVPLEYAPLIYEYIKGLQGGVRTRLRDAALSIKVKDGEDGAAGFGEDMSASTAKDRERRQQEYEAYCEEYATTMAKSHGSKVMGYDEGVLLGISDELMKARAVKRSRAEMILAEMSAGATPEEAERLAIPRDTGLTFGEGDDGQCQKNDDPKQKVARKRKQRTANVEDDSSTSDDSSDSDESDSSSEDEEAPQDNRREETSSESSSSGSGSDDSEEDSEDDESSSGSGSGSSSGSDVEGTDSENGGIE